MKRIVLPALAIVGLALLARVVLAEETKKEPEKKPGTDEGEVGETVPFSGGGESHTLYVKVEGSNATLMVQSRPMTVASWLWLLEPWPDGSDSPDAA